MAFQFAQKSNEAICVALGMDPTTVRRITIVCEQGQLPHVIVEHVGISDNLPPTLSEFDIVKPEEPSTE